MRVAGSVLIWLLCCLYSLQRKLHFLTAARPDITEARYALGIMCRDGKGVHRDQAKAAGLFLSPAELGKPTAQANLGEMYASGRGVPLDYVEAYTNGSASPRDRANCGAPRLVRVLQHYDQTTLQKAEGRSSEWQQQHPTLTAKARNPASIPQPD